MSELENEFLLNNLITACEDLKLARRRFWTEYSKRAHKCFDTLEFITTDGEPRTGLANWDIEIWEDQATLSMTGHHGYETYDVAEHWIKVETLMYDWQAWVEEKETKVTKINREKLASKQRLNEADRERELEEYLKLKTKFEGDE